MTPTLDYNEMRDKLREYMKLSGKTQAVIAKELDYSVAAVSQFLNDKYTGDNEEFAARVNQLLNMGAVRKSLAKAPDFCMELSNTKSMLNQISIAHATNDILLLYGPAGCGKSTACSYYADHHKGTVLIEADATTNSPRAVLSLIAEEVGENSRGTTTIIMRTLVKYFKGSNKLLIIDEAQHLTEKTFDTIRALNDKAGIGIVYSGNPSILKNMFGCHQEQFDQVFSRIGYHCKLDNEYSFDDIKQIFRNHNLDKDCLKYLLKTSHKKGGLRIMIKLYKLAANIANALELPVSVDILEDAKRRMGISGVS